VGKRRYVAGGAVNVSGQLHAADTYVEINGHSGWDGGLIMWSGVAAGGGVSRVIYWGLFFFGSSPNFELTFYLSSVKLKPNKKEECKLEQNKAGYLSIWTRDVIE